MSSLDPSLSRSDFFQYSPEIDKKIKELIHLVGTDPDSLEGNLIGQIIGSSLKMGRDKFDMGQLKLMTRAFKEIRYGYRVFNEYQKGRCVSIFGSARTPESHPDYQTARAFSAAMTAEGWDCMTGAADGIMQAGLEGAPPEARFGLSIRLPFENTSHSCMNGDPKLIAFRYFFTRKLMFASHSDALAAFPGGVGTQDEIFEVLTLMQTGRSRIVPVILLEGSQGNYWQAWEHYIQNSLLAKGFISPEDQNLYYKASGVEDAVNHIKQFYYRYHSSRYVKDLLVIRLLAPLNSLQISALNTEFQSLIKEGCIYATAPLPDEDDHLDLPRIAFSHHQKQFGLLRAMIDRINAY